MTNPPMDPNDPTGAQQPGGPFDQNPYPQGQPYPQNQYAQNPYAQNPYQPGGYGAPTGGRPRPKVDMKQAVTLFFKNYAVFNGRASRSEYWWVALFTWLIQVVLSGLANAMGDSGAANGIEVISGLWGLAIIVPSLAIVWRRLHDTGRSGGWFFIGFIPIVGWIILIVFLASPSRPDAWQRYDNGKLPVES